jgi:hypothetical protein
MVIKPLAAAGALPLLTAGALPLPLLTRERVALPDT